MNKLIDSYSSLSVDALLMAMSGYYQDIDNQFSSCQGFLYDSDLKLKTAGASKRQIHH
jgi:hypothetical protein